MPWLYGQTWLWYLIAFLVGLLLAWLLLVRPAQRRLRAAGSAPEPAVADDASTVTGPIPAVGAGMAGSAAAGAAAVGVAAAHDEPADDAAQRVDPEAPTEIIPAADPALSTLDSSRVDLSKREGAGSVTEEIPVVPTSAEEHGGGATAAVAGGAAAAGAVALSKRHGDEAPVEEGSDEATTTISTAGDARDEEATDAGAVTGDAGPGDVPAADPAERTDDRPTTTISTAGTTADPIDRLDDEATTTFPAVAPTVDPADRVDEGATTALPSESTAAEHDATTSIPTATADPADRSGDGATAVPAEGAAAEHDATTTIPTIGGPADVADRPDDDATTMLPAGSGAREAPFPAGGSDETAGLATAGAHDELAEIPPATAGDTVTVTPLDGDDESTAVVRPEGDAASAEGFVRADAETPPIGTPAVPAAETTQDTPVAAPSAGSDADRTGSGVGGELGAAAGVGAIGAAAAGAAVVGRGHDEAGDASTTVVEPVAGDRTGPAESSTIAGPVAEDRTADGQAGADVRHDSTPPPVAGGPAADMPGAEAGGSAEDAEDRAVLDRGAGSTPARPVVDEPPADVEDHSALSRDDAPLVATEPAEGRSAVGDHGEAMPVLAGADVVGDRPSAADTTTVDHDEQALSGVAGHTQESEAAAEGALTASDAGSGSASGLGDSATAHPDGSAEGAGIAAAGGAAALGVAAAAGRHEADTTAGRHVAEHPLAGADGGRHEAVTTSGSAAEPPFGPGSAHPLADGSSPGPEYTVKGNADSMLFHTTDSPYYVRTRAEAWFITVEAAAAAGFAPWNARRKEAALHGLAASWEPGPYPQSATPAPDGGSPSPEFTIKGNADSMLYHTPESPYFVRTRAEAWFRTAADAEAAGFTAYTGR